MASKKSKSRKSGSKKSKSGMSGGKGSQVLLHPIADAGLAALLPTVGKVLAKAWSTDSMYQAGVSAVVGAVSYYGLGFYGYNAAALGAASGALALVAEKPLDKGAEYIGLSAMKTDAEERQIADAAERALPATATTEQRIAARVNALRANNATADQVTRLSPSATASAPATPATPAAARVARLAAARTVYAQLITHLSGLVPPLSVGGVPSATLRDAASDSVFTQGYNRGYDEGAAAISTGATSTAFAIPVLMSAPTATQDQSSKLGYLLGYIDSQANGLANAAGTTELRPKDATRYGAAVASMPTAPAFQQPAQPRFLPPPAPQATVAAPAPQSAHASAEPEVVQLADGRLIQLN